MLNINDLIGFGSASPVPILTSYVSGYVSAVDSAAGVTRNWTTVNLGAEFEDRVIIVSTRADTSVTINGVSATRFNPDAKSDRGIWGARVPTGTSVTVSTTGSIMIPRSYLFVYSVANLVTLEAIDSQSSDGPNNPTLNLYVPAGGSIIANSASTNVHTWTGLTEDIDSLVESVYYSGASANISDGGSKAVQVTTAAATEDVAAISIGNI